MRKVFRIFAILWLFALLTACASTPQEKQKSECKKMMSQLQKRPQKYDTAAKEEMLKKIIKNELSSKFSDEELKDRSFDELVALLFNTDSNLKSYGKAAVITKKIIPDFPESIDNYSKDTIVKLQVEVMKTGKIERVLVKESVDNSPGGIDEKAIEAVKKYEFKPVTVLNVPVNGWAIVDVRLHRKKTSGNVMDEDPPKLVHHVKSEYPKLAKELGIEGSVGLRVEICEDGTVGEVKVIKSLMPGPEGIDQAAVKAVKQFKYTPAKFKGEPVAVWLEFALFFSLK